MNYTIILPGVHLITLPSDRKSSEIEMVFTSGGSYFEKPEQRGLTHLLEHCMVSRTQSYSYESLKELLFRQHIMLNAYTSPLTLGIEGKSHHTNASDLLQIVLSCGITPSFIQEDLDRERDIVLREISERSGDPQYQLHFDTQREIFDESSVEVHEVIGSSDCVAQTQLSDLYDIHAALLNQSHIVLMISGGFDEEDLTQQVKNFVNNVDVLKNREYLQLQPLDLNIQSHFLKTDSRQTVIHPLAHEHVEISCFIPVNIHFETRGLRNIFQSLVLDFYGSLYQKLREEKGYIYSLQSQFALNAQQLIIYCSCDEEFVELIMEEITQHLQDLKKLFDEPKFNDYKSIITKKAEMLQDDPSYLVQHLYHMLRLYNVAERHTDYTQHLNSITTEQYLEFCDSISSGVDHMKWVFVSKSPTILSLSV